MGISKINHNFFLKLQIFTALDIPTLIIRSTIPANTLPAVKKVSDNNNYI